MDEERFFRLKSSGALFDPIIIIFFVTRLRLFFVDGNNGGQISPNSDVIWSIIDSCGSMTFSAIEDDDDDDDDEEDEGGGVRRLTMAIEEGGDSLVARIDNDEDKQGE